jgi:hypothetical protein
MRRFLLPAAVVLGLLATANEAVTLVGAVSAVSAAEPFKWWHLQIVLSHAVTTAWTALVSYAAVQVCRRVIAVGTSATA